FVEEVYAPLNKSGDEVGSQLIDGQVVTPPGFKEAWHQAAEAGWIGMISQPDFGGQGLPLSVAVGVLEAMYGANPALYTTAMLTAGAAGLIAAFGDDAQQAAFCENMITGHWGGTMCLSEPNAGSAVGDIATRATKAADGEHYLIKGSKCWISGGDHDFTENIVHLVLARTEGAPPGPKGISLFIVPKYRLDADGNPTVPNDVSTVRLEHKLGIKASPTAVLEFGGDNACHGYLLEGECRGMAQMFKLMNEARLQVAYQGLGAASGAY
ncbi:MAG: acyl-CoA dehydrogenase, partial [Gammaproteobacteria bacterium]|nr:acyl-CoA dehydrogenase [Gammaproteobacteria bacterium]NIR97983.1 acyl-CoA dehydrogenase [Gammaproteobacteria bacterium]NIT63681.1 acyl-CoA dehydrogenase [Gammaproteobacteria bacterium]NIV20610.1 acyl-CoA dehydrogenase [Gammaproteobacteria bacterium]NIY32261.1 acyl-CoA dehydrogenase [Gammaproteobacteria bacterium]